MEVRLKKIEIEYDPEALSVEIDGVTYEKVFSDTTEQLELEFTDQELDKYEQLAKDLQYVSIPEMIRASLKDFVAKEAAKVSSEEK